MVTIHPPARIKASRRKQKRQEGRKKERYPKQWQTGYSPRPLTSLDQNQTLHGGWPVVCSYTCHVWSKSVKGLRRCWGSKMALPHYFGQCLKQQFVLPYKPWCNGVADALKYAAFVHVLLPSRHRPAVLGQTVWAIRHLTMTLFYLYLMQVLIYSQKKV